MTDAPEKSLRPSQLCSLINKDNRLLPNERQKVNRSSIGNFRVARVIHDGLYKKDGRRFYYTEEAAEAVVLAKIIGRYVVATPEAVGRLYEKIFGNVKRPITNMYQLSALYEEDPDFPRFLRKIIDIGIELPPEILDFAAPTGEEEKDGAP